MAKYKSESEWGKAESKKITGTGYISGTPTTGNLSKWASYAHQNREPGHSKAQAKHDLRPAGRGEAEVDWSDDWIQPQHEPARDRGWAKMDQVTAENTFTGPGGSKRGD